MRALVFSTLAVVGCYDFSGISDPRDGAADLGVPDLSAADLTAPDLGPPPKPVRFNTAPSFPVESHPRAVALVDLNGDGKSDLVTANTLAGSVSVLLNLGDGSFAPQRSFPTGGREPASLGVGDFDGDRKQDVAVGNYGGLNVMLLVGDGNGAFARQIPIAQGFAPTWIRVADFDSDNAPDLLVGADESTQPVRLLRNRGKGAFSVASTLAAEPTASLTVDATVGDWNRDGKLDYAVAVNGAALVGVGLALGKGDGTFVRGAWSRGGLAWPIQLAAGDFDGDGTQDLFVSDQNGLLVEQGLGDGRFTERATIPTSKVKGIVAGDFNGDRFVDLAYQSDQAVRVRLGDGKAAWSERAFVGLNWAEGLISGDVDGDRRADLVSFSASNSRVAVLRAAAGGELLASDMYTCCGGDGTVGVAHLDGDSRLDLVFVGGAGLRPTINVGGGRFQVAITPLPSASRPGAIAIGNFDGSGALDIAITDSSRDEVLLHLGAGSGTFAAPLRFPAGEAPLATAAGDFDGDPRRDLVVTNPSLDRVSILRGDAKGFTTPPTFHGTGKWPVAVAAVDVSGDGKSDLLVVNRDGDSVSVLLGTGGGLFAPQAQYPVGRSPRAITVADFDGDRKLDLAVADGRDHDLAVLKGAGDGTFAPALRLATSPVPLHVASGDFNRDGFSDLITVSERGNVDVLLGRPWLRFAPPQPVASLPRGDDEPAGLASGDFDGDGRLDLVAGFRNRFVILRNLTP